MRHEEERILKNHQLLIQFISNAGLPITVPQSLMPDHLFSVFEKEPFLTPVLISKQTQEGKNYNVIGHMQKARGCIIDPNSPYILDTFNICHDA